MKVVVDGTSHYIDTRGNGELPILLLHGLGGTHAAWGDIPGLLARSRRAIAPDLRGCGASERGRGPYTLPNLAQDCLAILDALGVRRCHLVGHSLGGVIAQELLTAAPARCASAVLVSTSSRVGETASAAWRKLADNVERRGLGSAERAVARGFSEPYAEANPELVREQGEIAVGCDPAVYAAQARAAASYDYTERLAAVAVPVLVVQGLADRLTSPGGSVLLDRALPNSTLKMIEGVGHNAHLEMGDAFARMVLDFVIAAEAGEG